MAAAPQGAQDPAYSPLSTHVIVNAETPLERQRGVLTPNGLFYHRNNFPYPEPPDWLAVEGAVERPARLAVPDLRRFEPRELTVTLECAGNGRAFLDPPVEGEQWRLGAVATARWSGVRLDDLLEAAGVLAAAVEIVFHGADGFARSLPLEAARHRDTLLATAMNGEPLPHEHGGPVRLVVPSWYGMASVKWLTRIEAAVERFTGHFQVERYVVDGEPVREMAVRAVITEPAAGATVEGRQITVAGYAWTGRGVVTAVDLSDDGGGSWRSARLVTPSTEYAWTRWEGDWSPGQPGPASLLARAQDSEGRVQPLEQRWNRLGYANNAAIPHPLTVSRTA